MAEKTLTKEGRAAKTVTIYEALCKFQAKLPTVEKKRQSYQFKYADLTDIWDAIRKPLTDNGLSVIQLIDTDDSGNTYVITKLCHVSGECIESRTMVAFTAKKPQELGALFTYNRRYALSAMLGIVSDEDVDSPKNSNVKYEEQPYSEPVISKEQLVELETLINGFSDIRDAMVKGYGRLANIKAKDFNNVCKVVKKRIEDKTKE